MGIGEADTALAVLSEVCPSTIFCSRAYLSFNIHQYLEGGVTSKILKCVDDTKLFLEKNNAIGDKQQLQDDIDKLFKWSDK